MKLRQNNIEKLDRQTFDVAIIGGGINGAVAASALTSQGASVALIDKGDFASFTSQESSNLVWGGFKYLEGLEFGLVRKLCMSRNHLIRSYPSQVKEIRFFVNLEKGFRFHRLFIYMGSWLYWLIGNFFTKPPRLLSKTIIEKEEPIVNLDNSQGGFEYSDAYLIDNDARFVFNFIRAALNHGGIAANYVEALGSERNSEGLWVTRAKDQIDGREITITSRVLLNTCGPYADGYNKKSKIDTEHHHLFSKGIHLIVNKVTESRRVLTFFASDGRLFFVIPMGPKSCVGTTDTRVEKIPPTITDEDRDFVLENINKLLQLDPPLTSKDIIAERCGVRPLVVEPQGEQDDKGDWTSLSRKHAMEVNYVQKQISVFGGKMTDCLNVGDEISRAVQSLGIDLPYAGIRWYGEPPDQIKEEFFHQARLMKLDEMTSKDSSEPLSSRLWRRYAASGLSLLEEIRQDPAMAEVLIQGAEYIRCELHHAAKHEMIIKLEDFLRRRSKIAQIARPNTIAYAPGLEEACHILFGESADKKYKEYFSRYEDI